METTVKKPDVHAGNMKHLLNWYPANGIKPEIGGVYQLADATDVLKRLLGRSARGNMILKPGNGETDNVQQFDEGDRSG